MCLCFRTRAGRRVCFHSQNLTTCFRPLRWSLRTWLKIFWDSEKICEVKLSKYWQMDECMCLWLQCTLVFNTLKRIFLLLKSFLYQLWFLVFYSLVILFKLGKKLIDKLWLKVGKKSEGYWCSLRHLDLVQCQINITLDQISEITEKALALWSVSLLKHSHFLRSAVNGPGSC